METSNPSQRLSRYELPGFGLPLNFTPHGSYVTETYGDDPKTYYDKPGKGDCWPLFMTALDSQ
jgi:hypothetical protein